MRAALYLRVSTTDGQTTENQRMALAKVAGHRGWEIVQTYEDTGISGAKGRDQRPAFNQMLKDAVRRRFDVLIAEAGGNLVPRAPAGEEARPPEGVAEDRGRHQDASEHRERHPQGGRTGRRRKRNCAASAAGDGRGVGGSGVTDLRQCPFCVSVAPSGQDGANPMKAAALDLPRRGFIAGLCAATAKSALTSADVIAGGDTTPTYSSARDLIQALAARQISARELLDASLKRIEAIDLKINAVVVRDFDRARVAADAADAALGRGERRPLLGLPMTVKEQFNVAGLPTTWGYPQFRDWRPDVDALAVQRLKTAGAIIIGKTNIPVGLMDWQSFNEVYGTTNNPWDFALTPGGSSGGSAVALAAGFVSLELGSDIGGSLRAPAHFCGVFSHKPSLDLIPQRGSGYPATPAIPVRGDLSVIGPMARSASDLALELEVLAGPDELWDGIGYKLTLPPARHETLADFRVLVIDTHPLCPTASGVTAALEQLIEKLVSSAARSGARTRIHPT